MSEFNYCNYCAKKLTSPFVTKDSQGFCNKHCLKSYFDPHYKNNEFNAVLDAVSKKITKKLQIEKIALSKVVLKSRNGGLGSVTFYTGETAIKEEFAKFVLNLDERSGWSCRPLIRNFDLPIAKTEFLSDVLSMIVEDVLDDMGILR